MSDPVSGCGLDPKVAELVNVDPDLPLDFRPHVCWVMMFCWPDEEIPSDPGRMECQGCGRRWKLIEEL